MTRRVQWTTAAWRDLEQVADYIARDSRHYAASFVRKVRNTARSLDQFAERGRVVPEFGRADVRELIVRPYRLIYRIHDDRVGIVAFIHGARDLGALWEREQRPDPAP
jgi:plasmid stabilization system protein ParE